MSRRGRRAPTRLTQNLKSRPYTSVYKPVGSIGRVMQVIETEMLYSFTVLIGLVVFVGFVQECFGTSLRAHYEFCGVYPISKTFNLKDPVTNDPCTLQIFTFMCGGFCRTETEISSRDMKTDPTGKYRLAPPQPKCKCCEPVQQPGIRSHPPMTYQCLEGHKWNHTLTMRDPINACSCRICSSSNIVQ